MQTMQAFHADAAPRDAAYGIGADSRQPRHAVWREAFRQYRIAALDAGYPVSVGNVETTDEPTCSRDERGRLVAHVRCIPEEIIAAAAAVADNPAPAIQVSISVSDDHWEHAPGIRRAAAVRMIEGAVALARQHVPTVHVRLEDASNADPAFVRQCALAAVEAGACRIILDDAAKGGAPAQSVTPVARDLAAFLEGRAVVCAPCAVGAAVSTLAL